MNRLNFDGAKLYSTSWLRAKPQFSLIERLSADTYQVFLPDGQDSHTVTFAKDGGQYVGHCDCKGHEFGQWPCAHLCTLRKAEFGGVKDVHGRPVRAEPYPEVVTDGGDSFISYTAGSDGEVFGRPEEQL